MTHLDIAKKEGREKFKKCPIIISKFNPDEPIYGEENKKCLRHLESDLSGHERAIEIALLQDLVEEANIMKKEDDHGPFCDCSSHGYNEAFTNLITKYQDRINELKS